MKKSILLSLIAGCMLIVFGAYAQENTPKQRTQKITASAPSTTFKRCATTEGIRYRMQTDKNYYESFHRKLTQLDLQTPSAQRETNISKLNGIVTIPVVVHIVLPNPSIVTDADVEYFINRLNLDFSGLNPDSTNAADFYNVRGHSLIRFALAKRDPNGRPTNGIERKNGNINIGFAEPQPIKSANQGGINPWPHTQYYNIWIGVGSNSVLGIAPEIGPGTAATDGVSIDYRAFANNSCYSAPNFNLARTAVHEIGHNFGLYHIFEGSCADNDFKQITSQNLSLPTSLLKSADDTPGQSGETSGCPTGSSASGCSDTPNPPGKMYQNFMDYTNDACYSMFTKGQVERMHYVLENFRPGYLTTQGHIPVSSASLDLSAYESVNPGGSEIVGCTGKIYPSTLSCGGAFEPKFRIRNSGTTVITSLIAGYRLNNGTAITQPITLNLTPGSSTVISFPSVIVGVGNNEFKFFTSLPNGMNDPIPTNDTIMATLGISAPSSPYINEGFENQFIPIGWTLNNPDNDITWSRVPPGNTSTYAAFFENYEYNARGEIDDLRTPNLQIANVQSLKISFDLAHKNYPSIGNHDTLSVLASSDCGQTFTTIYKKWGSTLSTAGTSEDYYATATNADWRRESITIDNSLLTNSHLLFAFRNTNRFGNNIFLDNVKVEPQYRRDIQVSMINKPNSLVCEANITPAITVRNNGTEIVTGFKVNYSINNGNVLTANVVNINLSSGAQTNVNLPASIIPGVGQHQITAYVTDLVTTNGNGDMLLANDTLRQQFSLVAIAKDSIRQDFEKLQFPPVGWSIANPDGGITWQHFTPGRNSTGSAFINNYNYERFNEKDELISPLLQYGKVDSVVLSFDLSAAVYSKPNTTTDPIDTLEILITKDCGSTYTSVYKKWGVALQTLGNPNTGFEDEFFPKNDNQWRREKVDLTSLSEIGSFLVTFRSTTNWENNIFLDNIHLTTKTLPALLKEKGYLVTSTSNPEKFNVWFYQSPKNLRYINVHTSTGQLVWQQQYSGNANNLIPVDLSGKPSGIYVVTMGYENKKEKVSERIFKR